MRKQYNKLVRDRIPEIIEKSSGQYETAILTEIDYRKALLAKLVEEAQEVSQASPEELPVELADLYEVVDSILLANNIDPDTVRTIQTERRINRGGFTKHILLKWSETPE